MISVSRNHDPHQRKINPRIRTNTRPTRQLSGARKYLRPSTSMYQHIKAILGASGSDMSHVVKVQIFLTDLSTFKDVNVVFEKGFPNEPARSTVGVAALPLGVDIETYCVAIAK